MLFKTRMGLCCPAENCEISAHKRKSGGWWISAQVKQGEGEGKSLFGLKQFRLGGSWFHLAAFADNAETESEIGKAMQIIADAIANKSPMCDLSHIGSAEAWGQAWVPIRWS